MLHFEAPDQAALWLRRRVQGVLQSDSRKVGPGDGFIAWPGAASDARQYVRLALEHGAAACLVERHGWEKFDIDHEDVASYEELKSGSGLIAAAYFDTPSAQLKVVAITGTNGKTSTSWWLAQALSSLTMSAKIPCALVGTLGVGGFGQSLQETGLTTPDPVLLQMSFRKFLQEGFQACAIEASSIGLAEHRLAGTLIHTAIFTNFTQDHLDYHGSMEAYWQAKASLFDWTGLRAAVINIDDIHGASLAKKIGLRGLDLWTFSALGDARLHAKDIEMQPDGLRFTVCEGDARCHLTTRLLGAYNVSNILGVIAAMRTLGVPLDAAVQACAALTAVPGRMQCIDTAGQPMVVVDYAHTPDALAKALEALRPLAGLRCGELWCVFGCGGQRDPLKRPLMGAVADQNANRVVLTSDNPRTEKPEKIIHQIMQGVEGFARVEIESNRAQAIAQTIRQAKAQDVILIAGKGHESYQEIDGARFEFSDALHAHHALRLRANDTGVRQ